MEVSINQLNVIIVTIWDTQQIIFSDTRIRIFHVDNQTKVGETILQILKDTQTTEQIPDTEQLMFLSIELTFQKEVFQIQSEDTIETDYSYIQSEPLDVYSRQILHDDDIQDTVYVTDEEFNTLFYDIKQSSDTEASEQEVPDQASPSQLFLHLCAHSKIHSQCVLLKLMVRLRECGSKLYSDLIPKSILI